MFRCQSGCLRYADVLQEKTRFGVKSNMSECSTQTWQEINWPLVERRIARLQRRIYQAQTEGNRGKVIFLQKVLLKSLDAKLLATRRVTTENKGRSTPGVDGNVILTPEGKIKLAHRLKIDGKSSPIRRTFVPKPGSKEGRPLGIPIIRDRAKQALVKLALEPQWEAVFEANSYGFRPGRSCHDAISAIYSNLRGGKTRYILDADISKCFDRIQHEKLLLKLNTFPALETQVQAWLKADIMRGYANRPKSVEASIAGTPQGGVISPLLSNIALHGMEQYLKEWYANEHFPKQPDSNRTIAARDRKRQLAVIRYADDFVVIGRSLNTIQEAQIKVEEFLKEVGLELSPTKTSIRCSTEGFDFLGFHIICIQGNKNPHRLKIHISRKSKEKLLDKVSEIIHKNRSASAYALCKILSPVIIGWANYFKFFECSNDFAQVNYAIYGMIRAWVFRRTSKGIKSRHDLKEKYFPSDKTYLFKGVNHKDNWVLFGTTKTEKGKIIEAFLPKITWVKSVAYIKVQETRSPYDGDVIYWGKRTLKFTGKNSRLERLLTRQKCQCTICGERFWPTCLIEVDHKVPKADNGPDTWENLQAVHKACHVKKSNLEAQIRKNRRQYETKVKRYKTVKIRMKR